MVENGQDHRRRYGIREVSARLVSFSSAREAGAKDICIHQGIVNPHLCYLCPRYGGGGHDSFELPSSRFPEVTWAKRGENKLGTKGEHGQHSKTNSPAGDNASVSSWQEVLEVALVVVYVSNPRNESMHCKS